MRESTDEQTEEQLFTLYRNVKFFREHEGLTVKQFADIINIGEEDLMAAEACTNTGCFDQYHLQSIRDYFEISMENLLQVKFYEQPYQENRARVSTVCRNVKFLREQHGLTTARFAKIINIYEEDLILAEACYAVGFFCDFHIKNICDYFSLSPNDLFITKLFETA